MNTQYKVVTGIGGYLVIREKKDVNGKVIKVDITDRFSSREEAQAKARLSNYIMLKARESLRESAVR